MVGEGGGEEGGVRRCVRSEEGGCWIGGSGLECVGVGVDYFFLFRVSANIKGSIF